MTSIVFDRAERVCKLAGLILLGLLAAIHVAGCGVPASAIALAEQNRAEHPGPSRPTCAAGGLVPPTRPGSRRHGGSGRTGTHRHRARISVRTSITPDNPTTPSFRTRRLPGSRNSASGSPGSASASTPRSPTAPPPRRLSPTATRPKSTSPSARPASIPTASCAMHWHSTRSTYLYSTSPSPRSGLPLSPAATRSSTPTCPHASPRPPPPAHSNPSRRSPAISKSRPASPSSTPGAPLGLAASPGTARGVRNVNLPR